MGKHKDLTGQRFGRLTVVKRAENVDGRATWTCLCDCGKSAIVSAKNLKNGSTNSCGCLKREVLIKTLGNTAGAIRELYWREGTMLNRLGQKPSKRSCSGVTGVFPDRARGCWAAEISISGVKHNLGRFAKIEDAIKARKLAEDQYFEPILKKYKFIQEDTQ